MIFALSGPRGLAPAPESTAMELERSWRLRKGRGPTGRGSPPAFPRRHRAPVLESLRDPVWHL